MSKLYSQLVGCSFKYGILWNARIDVVRESIVVACSWCVSSVLVSSQNSLCFAHRCLPCLLLSRVTLVIRKRQRKGLNFLISLFCLSAKYTVIPQIKGMSVARVKKSHTLLKLSVFVSQIYTLQYYESFAADLVLGTSLNR